MSTFVERPASNSVSSAKSGTWIVVPAFNEGGRLANVLKDLCCHYENVVVVDDGSSDDTVSLATNFPIWLLTHPLNMGQGAALQTGIDFALARGADVIVTFDSDGQHVVDDIAGLVHCLESGCDVALGSRFLGRTENMPWVRWATLKGAVIFTRVVSRIHVTDTHNGLRALSRRAAQQLRITENRMAHASEILHQIKQRQLTFREYPVTIRYSAASLAKGQSLWNVFSIVSHFLLGRLVR